jgi:hypothetical protein
MLSRATIISCFPYGRGLPIAAMPAGGIQLATGANHLSLSDSCRPGLRPARPQNGGILATGSISACKGVATLLG